MYIETHALVCVYIYKYVCRETLFCICMYAHMHVCMYVDTHAYA